MQSSPSRPSRQSNARELSAWAASRSAELQKLPLGPVAESAPTLAMLAPALPSLAFLCLSVCFIMARCFSGTALASSRRRGTWHVCSRAMSCGDAGGIISAEDFGLVVRAMGCEGYDYVGGAAPRTEVVKGRELLV